MVRNTLKICEYYQGENANPLGGEDKNFDFETGPNTNAKYSCAAKLNDEMFVFGGQESYSKQVTLDLKLKFSYYLELRSVK